MTLFLKLLPIITKSLYSGVFGAQKIRKQHFLIFHFSGSLIGDFTISIAFKIGLRVKLCKTLRTHILETVGAKMLKFSGFSYFNDKIKW